MIIKSAWAPLPGILPADTHSDNFVGGLAQWWLRSYPKTEPLFLQIGFPGPHPPYDPTPDMAAQYIDRDLPLPSVTQAELDGQPPPFLELRRHNTEVDHDSIVHLENSIAGAIAALARLLRRQREHDRPAGRADHGDPGRRRVSGKQRRDLHQRSWRLPGRSRAYPEMDDVRHHHAGAGNILVARALPKRGARVSAQCQWMDIGRTILEMADVEPAESMQAQSLLPALLGEHWAGREYVYAEHPADGNYEGPYMTMIRSERWKLAHFLDQDYGQLFDLSCRSRRGQQPLG